MSPVAKKLVVAGLIVALLASGMALGVAADRLWLRQGARPATPATPAEEAPRTRGEDREKRLLERFRGQLGLDDHQTRHTAEQIRLMFEEADAIRRRSQKELREARARHQAAIMAVLTPAQKEQFAKMIEAYEKRRADEPRGRRR